MDEIISGFQSRINVTKAFLPPKNEYFKQIETIWDNYWLTNKGPLHNELEEELKNYLKVKACKLYVNGHLALDIALKSLRINGEVITTPFTFASTTHAIVMNGLKPVFCDINIKDYNIDVSKIEELITEKTTAIIPVHVYGNPCDVIEIERISSKYGLKVIYDAAHATGVEINGTGIGNYGDISMFSFHATKVFNTIEGGLLTFNNDELDKPLELLKNFGITGKETVDEVGLNAKMSEFHAAMGLVNLRYLEQQVEQRKKLAKIYKTNLQEIEGIYMLKEKEGIKYNYAYLPILIDEKKCISRDLLYNELIKFNIYTRKYFYPIVTDYKCYKNTFNDDKLFNAKYVSERILTLPIYGELEVEDVIKITKIIKFIIKINK